MNLILKCLPKNFVYYSGAVALLMLVLLSFCLGVNEKSNNSRQRALLWERVKILEARIDVLVQSSRVVQTVTVGQDDKVQTKEQEVVDLISVALTKGMKQNGLRE